MNEPIHVNDATFEKAVLKSPLPVIVDFWAPWCGPCRMVAPVLEKIAKEYAGKLVVAKVNTDENPEWATRYGVSGIPTMLFIAGGEVIHEQVGAVPQHYLKQIVDKFLEITAKSAAARGGLVLPHLQETLMPLYEFSCAKCGEEFEELVMSSKPEALAEVACPECGSHKVTKKVSTFASSASRQFVRRHQPRLSCAPSGGG